jgi:hypothetical protein
MDLQNAVLIALIGAVAGLLGGMLGLGGAIIIIRNANSARYFEENFCRNACGYCDKNWLRKANCFSFCNGLWEYRNEYI